MKRPALICLCPFRWAAALLPALLVSVLFFSLPAAAEDPLVKILEGIKKNYACLEGLTVPYTRDVVTRSMAILDDNIKSDLAEGLIHFKPPHFLRIEQKKPQEELVISNNITLWWYVPGKKEVYQYPADRLGEELRLLSDIFQGLRDVVDGFVVELLAYNVEGYHELKLIPNPPWPELDFVHLTVSQKDNTLHIIELHNYLGGFTRFTLGDLIPQKGFEEGFFTFQVPEGVKVIQE